MNTDYFKAGDKVKIKPGTRYYFDNSIDNPADEIGSVVSVWGDGLDPDLHQYMVRWQNGANSYSRSDLIPAGPPIMLEARL